MSDVAAAFILDRVRHLEVIRTAHVQQFRRLAAIARELGLSLLVDGGSDGSFPNLVPILFPRPLRLDQLSGGPIVLHKYHAPLTPQPRADALFARIVCFPCHGGVSEVTDRALRSNLVRFM